MSDYNYVGLSGYEFERVVRDLFQEMHGVTYETSPPGPDGGVDLRYVRPSGETTVIQCKHYVKSTVSTLVSHLRRIEVPKVRGLAPTRYILVTSLDLSPSVKDEIAALFGPYCTTSGDVLGGLDVSNLLGRYPVVADRNIKLWLTSEPVLRRVLQAGIFDDSEREVERVRRRLALYVVNPSLKRARRILEDQHVCIVAGLPGIGKTTLAQMLLIEYEDRGYSVIRVPNHLSQVIGAARRGGKAIFYFDDFLGQTVLERWERNEDQRLVEFMESVRQEANWRFILTTREYILEEARLQSEALSRLYTGEQTCVIRLDTDYSPAVRARVLYQHLYFSDLPSTHTLALLRSGAVEKILRHRNYSPRLIDLLTSQVYTPLVSADDYPGEFLRTLDDPQRLWAVAYRAMNSAAQDLALTMASLPDSVRIDHLRLAFESLRIRRATRLNQSRRADEFEESLRILDGTMLRTQAKGGNGSREIVISFHNPSVRDFLQSRLVTHSADTADLIAAGVFLDQYTRLFQGKSEEPYPQVLRDPDAFVDGVSRVISGETAHFGTEFNVLWASHWGRITAHVESLESRALFAFDVARVLRTDAAESLRASAFDTLRRYIVTHQKVNLAHAATFLRMVYKEHARDPFLDEALINELLTLIINQMFWDNDVHRLVELFKILPQIFTPAHTEAARQAIRKCAEQFSEGDFSPETPALFFEAASTLSYAAELFDLDIMELIEAIEERGRNADEEEEEEPEYDHESDDDGYRPGVPDSKVLFARLEREISARDEA